MYPFSESANVQAFNPHFVAIYWIKLSRPTIDSSIAMLQDGIYADWMVLLLNLGKDVQGWGTKNCTQFV